MYLKKNAYSVYTNNNINNLTKNCTYYISIFYNRYTKDELSIIVTNDFFLYF